MGLGEAMSVMLKLEVDISAIAELKKAQKQLEKFENKAEMAGTEASQAFMKGGLSAKQLAKKTDIVGEKFDKTRMAIQGLTNETDESSSRFAMFGERAENAVEKIGDAARLAAAQLSAASRVMVDGIDKLGDASKVAATKFKASTKAMRAGLAKVGASAQAAAAKVTALTGAIGRAKMAMLGLMFTSLNMVFVFGGILALSPRIRARLVELAGALRLIAIEAGKMVGPKIKELTNFIMDLDQESRKFIAKIAVMGTALSLAGVLIGAFGQAFLTVLGGISPVIKGIGLFVSILGTMGSAIVGGISMLGTLVMGLGKVVVAAGSATASVVSLTSALITKFAVAAAGSASTAASTVGSGLLLMGKKMGLTAASFTAGSTAIGGAMSAIASVVGAISLPVTALIAGIGLSMVFAAAMFSKGGGNIKKTMISIFNKLKPLINGLMQAFKDMTVEILKLFGMLSKNMGKFIQKFSSQISNVIKPLIKGLGTIFIVTVNVIINAVSALAKNARKGFEAVRDVAVKSAKQATSGWNSFIDFIFPALRTMVDIANKIRQALNMDTIDLPTKEDLKIGGPGGAFEGMLEDFDKKASDIQLKMAEIIGGEDARKQVKAFQGAVDEALKEENIDKIGEGYEKFGKTLKDTASKLDKQEATISNIVSKVKEMGGQAKKGLKDMIPNQLLKKLGLFGDKVKKGRNELEKIQKSRNKFRALDKAGVPMKEMYTISQRKIQDGLEMKNVATRRGSSMLKGAMSKKDKIIKKVNNNEINIDADVSEEIDVRDMADEINEVIERSNKRASSTI